MMSIISVIIPVYNVEKYLNQCIDSVLGQTFVDFELILVDDGSVDSSGAICDEYARKDSRIVVIHQKNQGQSAARNNALKIAKGEWICFVDSDDFIHPQMLELLYAEAVNKSVGIVCCGYVEDELPPDSFGKRLTNYSSITESIDQSTLLKYRNQNGLFWVVCFKMIKRSVIGNEFFVEGRIYEDNAITPKWLVKSGKIAVIDAQLYFYRINKSGTTKKAFSIKQLDLLWAINYRVGFFKSIGYANLLPVECKTFISDSLYYYNLMKEEQFGFAQIKKLKYRLCFFIIRNKKYVNKKDIRRTISKMFPLINRIVKHFERKRK